MKSIEKSGILENQKSEGHSGRIGKMDKVEEKLVKEKENGSEEEEKTAKEIEDAEMR